MTWSMQCYNTKPSILALTSGLIYVASTFILCRRTLLPGTLIRIFTLTRKLRYACTTCLTRGSCCVFQMNYFQLGFCFCANFPFWIHLCFFFVKKKYYYMRVFCCVFIDISSQHVIVCSFTLLTSLPGTLVNHLLFFKVQRSFSTWHGQHRCGVACALILEPP